MSAFAEVSLPQGHPERREAMKKTGNAWGIAVKALTKNKLQTVLTMLGMTIGVATVLTMIALGAGAEASIQDQVRSAGMNLIIVQGGNWSRGNGSGNDSVMGASLRQESHAKLVSAVWEPSAHPRLVRVQGEAPAAGEAAGSEGGFVMKKKGRPGDGKEGRGASTTFTDADVEAIRKIKGVQFASGGIHDTVAIESADKRIVTSMHGDDTELLKIRRGWVFPFGRFYSKGEEKKSENVVALGQYVATQLFGAANPVGKTITLKGEPFKVVGVVGSGSWMVQPKEHDDQFDAVYVPVGAMKRLLGQSYLSVAAVTTESTGDVLRVENTLKELLRERHHISDNDPDDFTVVGEAHKTMEHSMRPDVASAVMGNAAHLDKMTLDQLGRTLDSASATMSALLISIATVSLIVGGIGVMNIMLLSVSQRTKEIGIRRAIGARSADVLTQFLLEAATLSVGGGLLGIILGVTLSVSIARTIGWSTSVSLPAVAISFVISAGIGIFFGYYPAKQASQVMPLTALRHE